MEWRGSGGRAVNGNRRVPGLIPDSSRERVEHVVPASAPDVLRLHDLLAILCLFAAHLQFRLKTDGGKFAITS